MLETTTSNSTRLMKVRCLNTEFTQSIFFKDMWKQSILTLNMLCLCVMHYKYEKSYVCEIIQTMKIKANGKVVISLNSS